MRFIALAASGWLAATVDRRAVVSFHRLRRLYWPVTIKHRQLRPVKRGAARDRKARLDVSRQAAMFQFRSDCKDRLMEPLIIIVVGCLASLLGGLALGWVLGGRGGRAGTRHDPIARDARRSG